MSDYDNTNSGALFKNDKEGNENRPDYRGNVNVEGKDFEISAWLKTAKSGVKYMSLSIQEPYAKKAPDVTANDTTGDIPF